jgi:hypothetical protein
LQMRAGMQANVHFVTVATIAKRDGAQVAAMP